MKKLNPTEEQVVLGDYIEVNFNEDYAPTAEDSDTKGYFKIVGILNCKDIYTNYKYLVELEDKNSRYFKENHLLIDDIFAVEEKYPGIYNDYKGKCGWLNKSLIRGFVDPANVPSKYLTSEDLKKYTASSEVKNSVEASGSSEQDEKANSPMTTEEKNKASSPDYNIGDWVQVWCDSDGQPFPYPKKEARLYRIVGKGNFNGEVHYILDIASVYPPIKDYGFGHELRKYKDYSTCKIESDYPLSGVVYFVPVENIKEKIKNKDFPYHGLEDSYLKKLKDGTIENYSAQRDKEFSKLAGEENTMSKFVTEVKDDAVEASYRVAAHQLNKAARTALVKLLKDSGAKRAQVKAFSDLLDSEGGLAALSVAIGWALTYVPTLSEHPKARRLAKEFRVNGMTIGGNMLAGGVVTQLLPALLSQLDALPDPGKVRVASESLPEKSQAVTLQDEEESEAQPVRSNRKS